MKLHDARFCRVRLCPICQWRRSIKTYAQMSQVLEVASSDGYRFIFLTLTMRNCEACELSDTLTSLLQGFNRLMKYKDVKKAVKGYYRGCEVKHD
ncbi:MAG: protein rep, partial [Porcipelethomonas sp.]